MVFNSLVLGHLIVHMSSRVSEQARERMCPAKVRLVFFTVKAITPLFEIEFQKLKKGNAQKFLLFHLLYGQKELAPFI